MKLVKMSLAAAVLLGASAFALDNVKVSGDAKLFYGTHDAGQDLFEKGAPLAGSYADTALRIGATGDLLKGVSFGVTGYAVSTLGLENNLVSNVWSGAHTLGANAGSFPADVQDAAWMGEAWMAATMGKTTLKVGRMELDTPLAFSEKWNIAPNTFEGAVVLNQDLPNTTLVAAWVGKSNSGNALSTVASGGDFSTFATDGAYAYGIVNNSIKPVVFQAWYYDVVRVAQAYWLQADWDCQLVKGVKLGAQYTSAEADAAPSADLNAYAFKAAYGVDKLNVSAAYSSVNEDGSIAMNVATGGQSKLYTEAWWNYGYVARAGQDTVTVAADYDASIAKVAAYYTDSSNDVAGNDMKELTVTASKSFGPLDATLAYISTDAEDQNAGEQFNSVQAYLTLNF